MNFFQPTKYTWIPFSLFMCIFLVVTVLSSSSIDIPWLLNLIVIYIPLFLVSFFFSLLSIDIQLGYWGVPEPIGWFFIVTINVLVSYVISNVISRIVTQKSV